MLRAPVRVVAVLLAVALALVVPGGAASAAATVANPLPSKSYGLSSYYGPRCMPVKGSSTYHLGQDMEASRGTDIDAVAAGTVTRAGTTSGGFGQWIVIDHTVGGVQFSSVYGHMVDGDKYVKVGQKVSKGQHIADVGSSGTSTSNHLHLEIWSGRYPSGTATDPLPFLKARGIDLVAGATRVATRTVPSSCTYYAAAKVNLRSGPSTSYSVLRTVPVNGRMTAKPGASSGTYWRKVTYGSTTGWMHRDYVSPTYTSLGTRYVTASSLNLRSSASTSGSILTAIPKGKAVSLIGTSSNGWVRVKYGSTVGYVSTKYLTSTKPGTVTATSLRYVTTSTLILRKTASRSASTVTVLYKSKAVRPTGPASGGWLPVTASGYYGFVETKYLSTTKPSTSLSYVTASSLSMRKGPSTSTTRITTLPKGKAVRHLKSPSGGWALVTASGKIGYVSTKYLSSKKP
ncbi:hypothetical protein GCM10025865_09730 [Paraoerskovia sediminicola]|uniref:SH3b domain-containing protein n=1 Tax=Paraoerskovia sediminicola TaxID=1138587 RepID=A0ABN6XA41_9CELL|nr:SH3 domain-containing protein [Paraoerskovia sediminicola]BDZ41674.1 hypothetical protein GCM10025865_09730 [Paraoerskovia sediminicola]